MTSEPKWTPGPWYTASDFVGPYRLVAGDTTIAQIGHDDAQTCVANCALIAAAPELYEALARLLKWVKPLVSGTDREEIDSIEQACVALRKARGE